MSSFSVWQVFHPYPLLLLATGLLLANLWRKRRETCTRLLLVTVPYLLLLLLSLPATSYLLLGSLEWQFPAVKARPDDVEAIVVLGSMVRQASGQRLRAELDENSMHRCLRAAELYRQGSPCPVLVSGGDDNPERWGPSCAEAMRDFLIQTGVRAADILVEDRSLTTYENAVESCKLLEERGLHKVALVTDGTHLVRAERCFRKQGVDTVPAGCQYRATPSSGRRFGVLPSPRAVTECETVFHEWLGLAWYWVKGRI
jgi:uncharacterized SAM-binding protein YcdF (DUF218 family)